MKKIYLGHTENSGNIALDLDKEGIKFILLLGGTGSGKSIFHQNLYKQLSETYSPGEISFIFLDNTCVDFNGWKSNYITKSIICNPKEAIKALDEAIAPDQGKKLFIHIEECDMIYTDRAAVEAVFNKIKALKGVCVVYSTSRLDWSYITDWRKRFINLTVAFRVPTANDSNALVGNDLLYRFRDAGDRVLIFNGQQIRCQPFTSEEANILRDFALRDENSALK